MNAKGQTTWREKINFNTVTAIIFLILWTVMFILVPYQIAKPKLIMGRALMGLEPTLFPRLATFSAIVLSIWYLAISFKISEKNLFKEVNKNAYFKVFASLIVFVAYALLFEPLGFVLASCLVAGTLSTFYGNRNVLIGLVVSVVVPLCIYYVFTHLLAVSLPEFPFF
ncbi:MAG: tripartite tricarboxylate transporter TctB family protein [Deltaproteobacteria bacterium]|nr:tripartite tricarboxylate transporter TctB family protein [Deltaproteobacteria bacterium]